MSDITASLETLVRQAPLTVGVYLSEAVERIDRQFGTGYAAKNPALVGAFLQAASMDFVGSVIAQQVREGIESAGEGIALALGDVSENVRSDHPLMAGNLNTLASAIQYAGEAIAKRIGGQF